VETLDAGSGAALGFEIIVVWAFDEVLTRGWAVTFATIKARLSSQSTPLQLLGS
jgi:hypothetical protein